MDFGIVNPAASVMYDDIPAKLRETLEDVIFNRAEKQDLLVEMAQKIAAEGKGKTAVADTQNGVKIAWKTLAACFDKWCK